MFERHDDCIFTYLLEIRRFLGTAGPGTAGGITLLFLHFICSLAVLQNEGFPLPE